MTFLTRRSFLSGVAVAATCPNVSFAEPAYPAGLTVRFVVGFPAGGGQDIVGRIVADRLSALWGVPTVVENVQGAGGNLAMDRVAKGPSDGTQVLIVPPGIATNQFLYPHLPFDPGKDLAPLALVASVPNLLCVRKDLPVNSVAELIAYAKANPGKLTYASSGVGTTLHLSAELFKKDGRSGDGPRGLSRRRPGAQRSGRPERRSHVRQHPRHQLARPVPVPSKLARHHAAGIGARPCRPMCCACRRRTPSSAYEMPSRRPGSAVSRWHPADTSRAKIERRYPQRDAERAHRYRDAAWPRWLTEVVGSSAGEFAAFIAAERSKWGSLIPGLKLRVE